MKKYFTFKQYALILLILFLLTIQSYGQVAGNFNIITQKWRWSTATEESLKKDGFITGASILGHKDIYGSGSSSRANLNLVRAWLNNLYPDASSSGYTIINWETGPYVTMKKNSTSSDAFKAAEGEILRLINEFKRLRPNVKISMYQMPYRFTYPSQNTAHNTPGKFDNIFAKIDFIAPSYYILFADEEVGLEKNLQYIQQNLDVALAYGKKFNKPVIPFVWHKIHPNVSDKYKGEIMQKEAFARYIKYISTYSYNSYKAAGVWWYDNLASQLDDVSGINNCLQGTVKNKETYYAMIANYGKYVKQVLNNSTTTTTPPQTAPKVVSYTLVNADTDKDIQTIAAGATLNLATLPTKNLNIRVNTEPATIGSVKMVLTGKLSKSVTDDSAPHALFGGTGTNYNAWIPSTGSYTLKATPYMAAGGGGTAGTALSINFIVIDEDVTITPVVQKVVSYTLVNADTDKDIQTITSGATLNLADLPTKNLNIRANTNPATVGSVKIVVSGMVSKSSMEGAAPYAVFGGTVTNYNAWVPSEGSYKVIATPYTAASGNGTVGTSLTINFTVIDQAPVKVEYSLTVGAIGSGMVIKNLEQISYEKGTTVTLTATPATGYQFSGWSGDTTGTTNPLQISIDSSTSILANFIPVLSEYSLTVGAMGSGMVTKSLEQNSYDKGTTVILTATAAPGYQFSGWSGDTTGTTNPLAVTLNNNKNIKAIFNLVQQSIEPVVAAKVATPNNVNALANAVAIYPNPATTNLHVEVGVAGEGLSEVTLNDLTGRVVLTKRINNSGQSLHTNLDIQNLESGIYIVSVNTPKGRTSKRIVIK